MFRRYFSATPIFLFVLFLSSGVNSFVTRSIKKMMTSTQEEGKEVELFIVGEKGRSQLARIYADVSRFTVARCSPPHLLVIGSPPFRHGFAHLAKASRKRNDTALLHTCDVSTTRTPFFGLAISPTMCPRRLSYPAARHR